MEYWLQLLNDKSGVLEIRVIVTCLVAFANIPHVMAKGKIQKP